MPAAALLVLALVAFAGCFGHSPSESPGTPVHVSTNTMEFRTTESNQDFVVVELFTSEGCSSCPPADALLADLATLDGVIALSFHVDYWNRLGWRDPYSSEAFSARQRRYAPTLDRRVYTPQLVVQGTRGFVGSRRRQALAEIERARAIELSVSVSLAASAQGRVVTVAHEVEDAPADAVLHLALVQHQAEQSVTRGENRGRTLRHANVVRAFESVPAGTGTHTLEVPEGLRAEDTSVVGYVQPEAIGPVIGAAREAVRTSPRP